MKKLSLTDLFFLFLAAVLLILFFSSCGEIFREEDAVGQPTVVLSQRTDSSSVWLVYNTYRPDTMFVDIFPHIDLIGQHYIGHGYGYQPVYKCTYKHGQDESQ